MRSGYVGIYNQGSTCYLNSVLQALYHLPAFRTQIFNLPNVEKNAVTLALRDIFAQLEVRNRNITTTELTKAFGWSTQEAAVQHDVHELTQQLFDSVETALKSTPHENLIRDMFGGLMIYRSRAVDGADYVSDRLEDFYDVELVVKDKANMEESLQEFASGERIEGVSVELTPGAAPTPHTIERSQHFLDCPKVLLVHPNRVAFDVETYELVTLRNVWSFECDVSLASYMVDEKTLKLDMESQEKLKKITKQTHLGARYTLRSILTHAGDANIGHYYVYVNFDGEWVRFNDEIVEAATAEEVSRSAFGGQPIQARYRLFDNERASLLMYVNDDVKDDLLRETPPPETILDVGRYIEYEQTRTLETRKLTYYVCSTDLIDVLDGVDGAAERQRKQISVRTPAGQRPGVALVAALAQELEVEPAQLRLYYFDRYKLVPWPIMDTSRGSYDSYYPSVYVDILPLALVSSEEGAAAAAGPLVFLRGIKSSDELDGPSRIVRSIPELRQALAPQCHIFFSNRDTQQLYEIQMAEEVVTGANLLYCTASNAQDVVTAYLKRRLLVQTHIFLYDDCTSERREVFHVPLEDNTPYTTLQRHVYTLLRDSKHNLPKAPSPQHVGFFRANSKTSYAFSMPAMDTLCVQGNAYEQTLYELWGRGEPNHTLVATILPLPLEKIDLSVRVTLNDGYASMPHVYVPAGAQVVTFRLLLQLLVQQLQPRLRDIQLKAISDQLAGKSAYVRLMRVYKGEVAAIETEMDDEIRTLSPGCLVLDKLSPVLAGYTRVDVRFCRRRSGEGFFGYPTNISVDTALTEKCDKVLRRIVKKLSYPDEEEAMKKWILCVMNDESKKTRTASKQEVLSDLVKDVGAAQFVFVVDRPHSLFLDGTDEEDRTQESIVIKSTSKTDLSAL